VTSILTGKNVFGSQHITGVVTPFGSIKTDCVVNCCGKLATLNITSESKVGGGDKGKSTYEIKGLRMYKQWECKNWNICVESTLL